MNLLEKAFSLPALRTDVKTEVRAGLTTFMTMAYIIFVNPAILSAGGVPAEGAITATCLVAGALCIAMGLTANYPFALASGMGLNAVVAYSIVIGLHQSWQVAMGMIVIEGILAVLLVLTNLREMMMDAIPLSLKRAIAIGIGLFIAVIGLVEGGFVVGHPATVVSLGDLTQPHVLVAAAGLAVTSALAAWRVKGSLLIGICVTAVASVFLGVVTFPHTIVSIPSDFSTFFQFDLAGAFRLSLLPMIFALFMSDFFDTMGTVIGVGGEGGFLDKKGSLPRLKQVLLIDSLGAVFGGMAGASSATTYIESAAGVSEGGRSGLTVVVTGVLFFLFLFFTPVIGVIAGGYQVAEGVYRHPITAPALIVVGCMMMGLISEIDFRKYEEGIPAFLTILVMPMTYSIAHGIGFGVISYCLIKVLTGRIREVHPLLYGVAVLFVVSFLVR